MAVVWLFFAMGSGFAPSPARSGRALMRRWSSSPGIRAKTWFEAVTQRILRFSRVVSDDQCSTHGTVVGSTRDERIGTKRTTGVSSPSESIPESISGPHPFRSELRSQRRALRGEGLLLHYLVRDHYPALSRNCGSPFTLAKARGASTSAGFPVQPYGTRVPVPDGCHVANPRSSTAAIAPSSTTLSGGILTARRVPKKSFQRIDSLVCPATL